MDHFEKIASEQRKKLAAAVTIDFKVEDNNGNRVVLSTDGSITGFTNGRQLEWVPTLSETQLNMMENGQGARVAAELLSQYSGFVKTALLDVKPRYEDREKQLEEVRTGPTIEHLNKDITSKNTGEINKVKEELLDPKQTGAGQGYKEELLEDAGLYGRKVVDVEVKKALHELIQEVNKGVPSEVIEKQLASHRAEGSASAHEVMSATINALGKAVVASMETPSRIMKVAQTLAQEPALTDMVGMAAAGAPMAEEQAEKDEFFGTESEPLDSVSAVLKQLGAAATQGITAKDIADALAVAVDEQEITKEGVARIAESLMAGADVPEEGLDVEATPSKTEELRQALQSAIESDANLISKEDLKSAISAMAMSTEDTGVTPDEVVDTVDSMPEKNLVAAIDRAKTATATEARLRARARREFWGVKTASKKDLTANVIGWLADYSTNFDISSKKIAMAAKRLASDFETAERLVAKAVEAKIKMDRTAGMTVTQNKTECLTFMCTCDELGVKPSDEGFEDAFKQKAISVLQEHGFDVDPGTFTFTNLNVSSLGDVSATISSSTTKTFKVDGSDSMGSDVDAGEEMGEDAGVVIMSEPARLARKARRFEVLARYAQIAPGMGAAPGMPPAAGGAPGAGPMDPSLGLGGAAGGAGVLGLTGTDAGAEMGEEDPMASGDVEPGEKKPWGSICPVCGSDDVNISESNADCQSCGSIYEIHMSINLVSQGEKGKASEEGAEPGLDMGEGMGGMGLGEATAPAEAGAAAPAPGMAPVASSSKAMFRLATTVDSDVYLKTAMADFDKMSEKRLPVGMICPSCGSRKAHKVKNNTFCYDCGSYAKTTVKANKNNPSMLDCTITWID